MKIFISYRRSDSEIMTRRIASSLKRHFGNENVVIDMDNFLLGNDFREDIIGQLSSSDVVLVIIGSLWQSTLQQKWSANNGEIDWVLRELETAFNQEKIVIPVMLDDASIPRKESLPTSIQELPNRNGMKIHTSPYKFADSVRHLIHKIEQAMGMYAIPQPSTEEYLSYLLLNSNWSIQASHDTNEVYLCEQDTAYSIVVDILSEECEDNYTSEWVDHFVGPHRTYPVYVKQDSHNIYKTYFVSVWGAKYFVPIPSISGTMDHPIYFWNVHSIDLQLARHIARFHTLYKTIEEFADHAQIELSE